MLVGLESWQPFSGGSLGNTLQLPTPSSKQRRTRGWRRCSWCVPPGIAVQDLLACPSFRNRASMLFAQYRIGHRRPHCLLRAKPEQGPSGLVSLLNSSKAAQGGRGLEKQQREGGSQETVSPAPLFSLMLQMCTWAKSGYERGGEEGKCE